MYQVSLPLLSLISFFPPLGQSDGPLQPMLHQDKVICSVDEPTSKIILMKVCHRYLKGCDDYSGRVVLQTHESLANISVVKKITEPISLPYSFVKRLDL